MEEGHAPCVALLRRTTVTLDGLLLLTGLSSRRIVRFGENESDLFLVIRVATVRFFNFDLGKKILGISAATIRDLILC